MSCEATVFRKYAEDDSLVVNRRQFPIVNKLLRSKNRNCLSNRLPKRKDFKILIKKYCGASRDRTDDLLNANQALSQLSYSPCIGRTIAQVGLRGLEPRTSSLSGMRSNHLSYKPKKKRYACSTRFEFDHIHSMSGFSLERR